MASGDRRNIRIGKKKAREYEEPKYFTKEHQKHRKESSKHYVEVSDDNAVVKITKGDKTKVLSGPETKNHGTGDADAFNPKEEISTSEKKRVIQMDCSPRVLQLSQPKKIVVYQNCKDFEHVLPPESLNRLREFLKEPAISEQYLKL